MTRPIPQLAPKGPFTELRSPAGLRESVHVFDQPSIDAVNAALAAGRPLLLRGEPGTGKSQLARAVAKELDWPLIATVVDSRLEARELLWRFDALARLGEAQLLGALRDPNARASLAVSDFIEPGPLWWAFDPSSASAQAARRAARAGEPYAPPYEGFADDKASVVLIDEIDKADPDVPNGLLEALGDGRFTPLGCPAVVMKGEQPPLIVLTTNEERALPDAFLRRCLVLQLALPEAEDALVERLALQIGKHHFPSVDAGVLEQAARLLHGDRVALKSRGLSPPGQAEYLDLVRAVTRQERYATREAQLDALAGIARFVYQKHPKDADPR